MTNAKRQREFKARNEARGLVQVHVWVPADKREQIRKTAKRLVAKAMQEIKNEN